MAEAMEEIRGARPRRFAPYPNYRKSGVTWIGEIPSHWDVAPVYARYRVELGKMLDAKRDTGESGGPYLRNVDVQWDRVNTDALPTMDFCASDRERYSLKSGDVLVCEGGEVGRTAIWCGEIDPCFYQKALHRVRPVSHRDVPRFFYYVMRGAAKQGVFVGGGNPNTIDHLTAVQLRHYRFPFPSTEEQLAIASFLDRETARIDGLVAKKERLIELLQEKRTALITHAVTQGRDPNVPMKDSGIEWLDKIPAHWAVKRVKHLALGHRSGIQMGPFGSMLKDLVFSDTGYKVYGQENTISGDFERGSRWITPHQYRDLRDYHLRFGDIVVTRKGSIGNARIVPNECAPGIIDSDTIRIRVDSGAVDPLLLVLLMHDARYMGQQIEAVRRGAVLGGLNTSTIANLIVAVPPMREQVELVLN